MKAIAINLKCEFEVYNSGHRMPIFVLMITDIFNVAATGAIANRAFDNNNVKRADISVQIPGPMQSPKS
jgi:hypothetical protein